MSVGEDLRSCKAKAIHTQKQLGWAHKLSERNGVPGDFQGRVNNVNHVDGVSDMASGRRLFGSVGGGFRKGQ